MPNFECACCGGGNTQPTIDRFAPRYLVGNVPAGDSNVPETGNFRYIPDTGDGSGLAQALLEAGINPGDIWVRPGTYGPVGPLNVPDNVTVKGAGIGLTVINGHTDTDQGVFVLGENCSLQDMTISGGSDTLAPAGNEALVTIPNRSCLLSNVEVDLTTWGLGQTKYAVLVTAISPTPLPNSFTTIQNCRLFVNFDFNQNVVGASPTPLVHRSADSSGVLKVFNTILYGGTVGFESPTGTTFLNDCILTENRDFGVLGSFLPDGSQIRVSGSAILGPFAGLFLNYTGVRFPNGGGYILNDSIVVDATGAGYKAGIHLGTNGNGASFPFVTNNVFIGFETSVLAGDGVDDSVNSALIQGNTFITPKRFGVKLGGLGSNGNNKVLDNSGFVDGTTNAIAVQVDSGNGNQISRNAFQWFLDPGSLSPVIRNNASKTSISENRLVYQGASPVLVNDAGDCNISDNFCERVNLPALPPFLPLPPVVKNTGNGCTICGNVILSDVDAKIFCIDTEGDLTAITGNRTKTGVNRFAILLNSDSNTAIGNTCENSAANIVSDLGAGNVWVGLNAST